jgi:hypothetical protein
MSCSSSSVGLSFLNFVKPREVPPEVRLRPVRDDLLSDCAIGVHIHWNEAIIERAAQNIKATTPLSL